MAVYIDKAIYGFGCMLMCHMVADLDIELHTMAKKIGVKRKWFQTKSTIPHYDICKSKRVLAIQAGAVEMTREQFVKMIVKHRKQKKNEKTKAIKDR